MSSEIKIYVFILFCLVSCLLTLGAEVQLLDNEVRTMKQKELEPFPQGGSMNKKEYLIFRRNGAEIPESFGKFISCISNVKILDTKPCVIRVEMQETTVEHMQEFLPRFFIEECPVHHPLLGHR